MIYLCFYEKTYYCLLVLQSGNFQNKKKQHDETPLVTSTDVEFEKNLTNSIKYYIIYELSR